MVPMNLLGLSDGRRMCYAEYGDQLGRPVFLLHGNPGSRLFWGAIPGSPFLPNLRIIAPDRPGYGRTEFKKNALERWPQDVAELADHLGIERFAMFAPSGGAPYALACAWKIPERLSAVALFGPVGPNHAEALEGTMRSLRLLWKVAGPLQPLVRIQMWLMAVLSRRNPAHLATRIRDLELSEADKTVFDRPEIRNVFKIDFPEAYQQNGIGSAYDATVPAAWPVPLNEVRTRVRVWHAERDQFVGNMPVYLAKNLPNAHLKRLPGAGHLWILDHIPEVLRDLLGTESP